MPTLNFNVKVKAGKRTPAKVECYYTAVNEQTITLINGRQITNQQIAEWIADNLQEALERSESMFRKFLADRAAGNT